MLGGFFCEFFLGFNFKCVYHMFNIQICMFIMHYWKPKNQPFVLMFIQEFVFASYASSVFAAIRRAIDVKEDLYLQSVAPEQLPYLEFVSNSKSGQDFFLRYVSVLPFIFEKKKNLLFILIMKYS